MPWSDGEEVEGKDELGRYTRGEKCSDLAFVIETGDVEFEVI